MIERRQPRSSGLAPAPTVSHELAAWIARGLREAGAQSRTLEAFVATGAPRVPARVVAQVWAEAGRTTNDPAFGLRLGERAPVGAFGLLDFVAGSCTTLGEAMREIVMRFELVSDACALTLEHREGAVSLVVQGGPCDGEDVRHAVECLFSVIVSRARETTRVDLLPLRVTFARSQPCAASSSALAELLRCPLEFDAPRDELVFSSSALDLPLVTASPSVRAALDREVRILTAPSSFVRRVEEAIGASFETLTIDRVAEHLGTSVRTLQRRLASCGASFDQVADDLRRARAFEMLRDDDASIAAIAAKLGFADASAFYRAFRRWTGATPGAYRGRVA